MESNENKAMLSDLVQDHINSNYPVWNFDPVIEIMVNDI